MRMQRFLNVLYGYIAMYVAIKENTKFVFTNSCHKYFVFAFIILYSYVLTYSDYL